MMRALIVYHSDYGNTEKMAKAIGAGMEAAGDVSLRIQRAVDTSLALLVEADILVFGTPVHMGSMAWQLKRLIDEAGKLWLENALEGKVGGAFVTGGGYGGGGGGAELTLMALHANFLEHGMVVVGFPKSLEGYADAGLHWGLYARTGDADGIPKGIDEKQLRAGRAYGAHLVHVAEKLLND